MFVRAAPFSGAGLSVGFNQGGNMKMNTMLRKVGVWSLMTTMLLAVSGCCFPGTSVSIPDEALEVTLRQAVGKPFGCLTERDLLGIVELQARNRGIVSLEGLEFCRSLTILDLEGNSIQSLTPLTDLINLTQLDVSRNQIKNLEPLAGLIFLEVLDLSGDLMQINTLSPLVANAVAGSGLGAGDIVYLPEAAILDSEGNVLNAFLDDFNALVKAQVTILFESPVDGTATK